MHSFPLATNLTDNVINKVRNYQSELHFTFGLLHVAAYTPTFRMATLNITSGFLKCLYSSKIYRNSLSYKNNNNNINCTITCSVKTHLFRRLYNFVQPSLLKFSSIWDDALFPLHIN